jgi:hypothetical protein
MDLLLHGYVLLRASGGLLRDRAGLLVDDLRSGERGALSPEYVGILLVVGGMIAAVIAAGLPARVTAGMSQALTDLGLPAAEAT